jgi:hypothetical protein
VSDGAVGWLLTVEPAGDVVAWSLHRDAGAPELVDAGLLRDVARARAVAEALLPNVRGGVWSGPLTRPEDERRGAEELGRGLLPPVLVQSLRSDRAERHTLSVASRGWLSGVPWDALALGSGAGAPRVLERARVLGAVAPALVANRAVAPIDRDPGERGLAVIDPGPPGGRSPQLYPAGLPPELLPGARIDAADVCQEDGAGLSADELSKALLSHPARLFYLGHIHAAAPGAPAAAGVVLSVGSRADVLTARRWIAEPRRWPAPARVAFVGCAGDDTGLTEQSGLVAAAINAGARLTTTTRWLLPTDEPGNAVRATTALALAVYEAHRAGDLVGTLRAWQLDQLDRWRHTGRSEHSPVLWASLVTYLTPQ